MNAAADLPAPYRLVHLAETDSTNAEAMRRALAGEPGPLWVIADRQTAGRGRSGRAWASEPENLFASLLISTECPAPRVGQLSLVAGVAAIDAITNAGLDRTAALRLKWPNDILIGPGKAGGILVESSTRPEGGMSAVIGVGLNLVSRPTELGAAATSLACHGLALSPREALCFLGDAMDTWLATWNEGEGFARVREAWLARGGAVGEALTVHAGTELVHGRFVGLDAEGALIVADSEGRERRFTFGDVALTGTIAGNHAEEDDENQ
jgi:BirA family biotin operon repressor/biotin-[acetyl-CoA-carboxylase] ligase